MLPKEFRLKINPSKTKSWTNKKEFYTPAFKLVIRFGNQEATPRIGFIVSGKMGKSVERNKIRRQLTEAVRQRLEKFPSRSEVLIIARKDATRKKYEEVSAFLDQVLPKIRRRG